MTFPLTVQGLVPQNRVIFSAGKGIIDGVSSITLSREEMTPNVVNQLSGLLGSKTSLISVTDVDDNPYTKATFDAKFGSPSGLGGTLESSPAFGDEAYDFIGVNATVATQVGEVRTVTLQLFDKDGNDVEEEIDLRLQILLPTGIPAAAAAWTISDGGSGTLVTTDAQAQIIITTNSSGEAVVDVEDIATGSGITVQMMIDILDSPGSGAFATRQARAALAFA